MHLSKRGKRRTLVLVGLCLVVGVVIAAAAGLSSLQKSRLDAAARREGLAAYAAGDVKLALEQLSLYLEGQKEDVEANMAYADARARQPLPGGKHLFEAVNVYTNYGLKVLERDPEQPNAAERRREILHRLLDCYGPLGLRLELTQTADQLLAIEPDSIDALAAKAEVLLIDRKFEEALPLTERLIELDPDNLSWRRLSLAVRSGMGASADQLLELCRQWSTNAKSDGRFHLLTATLLAERNQVDEAKAEMDRVVERGTATRDVLERSLSLLDLLDQPAQAAALFAATKARFPAEQWVREVGVRRLWRSDRVEAALAELEQLQTEFRGHVSNPLQQINAMVLIAAGRPEEARTSLDAMLNAPARSRELEAVRAWAVAVAGVLDSPAGKWAQTESKLQNALALSPDDAALHFLMGDLAEKTGDQTQAIASYARAHMLDPDWMSAGVASVNALLNAGRFDEAYREARLVYSRAPKDRIAPFVLMVRAYVGARDVGVLDADADTERDMIAMLEQVNDESKGNPDIEALLATVRILNGDLDGARQMMNTAIAAEPCDPLRLLALADVSAARGLAMEGLLVNRAAAAAPEGSPAAAFARAQLLASQGRGEEAIQVIDQALASDHLDARQRKRLDLARTALALRTGISGAAASLDRLVARYAEEPDVMEFVLALPESWNDPSRVAQAMANLKTSLGSNSLQVRLAEAAFLLRFHSQDEAMLAKAIVQINGVLALAPDSLAALTLMADAMMIGTHENLDRAIDSLQTAVALYPGESAALLRLVGLLQRKGDYDTAAVHLRSLARLQQAGAQVRRSELRLINAQGEFESGLMRAAAIVTASSPVADKLIVAAMQHRAGKIQDAERLYEQLLVEAPDDANVIAQAAEFFADTGRVELGLHIINDCKLDPASAARQVLIGSFNRRHGSLPEAQAALALALSVEPKSVAAHDELAKVHMAKGDRAEAARVAREGMELDPRHMGLRATFAAASLSLSDGERKAAIKVLRGMGQKDDDLLATLEVLDRVSFANGRPVPSERNLADALQLIEAHGRFLPAWQLAISLQVEGGRPADAASIARRAVGRFPGESQVSQWATQLLMNISRWDEAMVEAKEWRRRSLAAPFDADLAIAAINLQLGHAADAFNGLAPHESRLLAAREASPQQYQLWVHALAASGRFDRAVALISPLIKSDRAWRDRWSVVAMALADSEAYEALSLLESVVTEPAELLALTSQWTMLAKRSGRTECFDRAEDAAFKIGQDKQWLGQVTAAQGAIAEARGERQTAEAYYRKSLEQNPENIVAMNNLASILSATPQGCAEALPFMEKVLRVAPQQPDFLDTYATVLLGLGRLSDAERALQQARLIRPEDMGMMLTGAEIMLRKGQRTDTQRLLDLVELRLRAAPRPDPQLVARTENLKRRLGESQAVVTP